MNTDRIKARITELTASRERWNAQAQAALRMLQQANEEIVKHAGAIAELEALLKGMQPDGEEVQGDRVAQG